MSSVFLIDREIIFPRDFQFKRQSDSFMFLTGQFDGGVFIVIVIVTNLDIRIILDEIVIGHDEHPVIIVY